MPVLKIRDLIHQLRTAKESEESVTWRIDDCYSLSDDDIISTDAATTFGDDVATLTTLLPCATELEILKFVGPASSAVIIPSHLWQNLFESILCHKNSIRTVRFVDGALMNLQITNVLANIVQYNRNVVITTLDLSYNLSIPVEGISNIIDSIKYNQTIETLDLQSSLECLEGATELEQVQVGRSFCELLQSNTTLKYLVLDYNNLSSIICTGLGEGLRTNQGLRELHHRWNNLQVSGAIELAKSLRYNTYLTSLHIKNNPIGDDGAVAIAETLRYYNTTLKLIDICDTNITSIGFTALAKVLITNTTLLAYNVGGIFGQTNELIVSYLVPFLVALQYNSTLTTFDFYIPHESLFSLEQWNVLYNTINEMIQYNDTIWPFWYYWDLPDNPWRGDNTTTTTDIPPERTRRIAPKKGGRQRSDIYHWLIQTGLI